MTDAVDLFLGDVKCTLERFEPKPGDVFVLTIPAEVLTDELCKRLQDNWERALPYKIVVVSGDVGIRCVSETTSQSSGQEHPEGS